ncbi:MAG: hypothetical protein ACKPKO_04825, partial [Candidatus Fonsibacter sp.]
FSTTWSTVTAECLTIRGRGCETTSTADSQDPYAKRDCDNMNDERKRHTETAQRAPPSSREGRNFRQRDLYKVPEQTNYGNCSIYG